MTQPRNRRHCAYCSYRTAAGTLTIHLPDRTTAEPSCWTCAREAADYFGTRLGSRVSLHPFKP